MSPANFRQNLLHQPRRLSLRRAVFQIHLWVGLAFALYLVVISLSGALLVFKDELVRQTLPPTLHPYDPTLVAPPGIVLSSLTSLDPQAHLSNLQFPSPILPAFLLDGTDVHHAPVRWLADSQTGRVQLAPRTWVDVLRDLHYYLLLPRSWGMQLNGVGALALLLLAASGLALWWRGTRTWTRALRLDLRANLRRLTFDLHNSIGFWTLSIVLWWAFSGVYFAWYSQVTAAVAVFSPIRGMASPLAADAGPAGPPSTLAGVLAAAQAASPRARLWSISDPTLHSPEQYVLLDRGAPGDFSHRDIVRVRRDAHVLSVWHYGERHTLADWILWSMHPLHFGSLWGLPGKLLWATFGLTLACLTSTGVLLYWLRFLRPMLRREPRLPLLQWNSRTTPEEPENGV